MDAIGVAFEPAPTLYSTLPAAPIAVEVGLHPALFAAAGADRAAGFGPRDWLALSSTIDPRAARDVDELVARVRGTPAYRLQERVLGSVLRESCAVNRLLSGQLSVDCALACASSDGDVPPAACAGRDLIERMVEDPGAVRRQVLDGLTATWQRYGQAWTAALPAMQRLRNRAEAAPTRLYPLLPFDVTDDALVFAPCCRIALDRVDRIAVMPTPLATDGTWLAFETLDRRYRMAIPRPLAEFERALA